MANDRTGFTGTWEILDSSLKKTGSGATGTANSGMIRRPRVCGQTGTKRRRSVVSPNEVRRTGCQEVGVPHSSVEAGNGPSRTLWSEGGTALWTRRQTHAEDTVPHQRVSAILFHQNRSHNRADMLVLL
jgi:hypothetical protein